MVFNVGAADEMGLHLMKLLTMPIPILLWVHKLRFLSMLVVTHGTVHGVGVDWGRAFLMGTTFRVALF
ncbi:hypothetical protein D3C74_316020 [compost metagenome]